MTSIAGAGGIAEPLTEIAEMMTRHVVLPAPAIDAVTLWAAVAHLHDELDVSPFLSISSRVKRSGKSLLLDVLREIVPRPYAVGGRMGARTLAEIIERQRPTLLIDECDTFLGGDAEMRGALNASQRRAGASITRMAGDDTRQISTWAPKVLAGIGALPDTLADRSVRVVIERRPRSAAIVPWRARSAAWAGMRDRLAAWTDAMREPFRAALACLVPVPAVLDDRAADTWEGLVAIAGLADPAWERRAFDAAAALGAEDTERAHLLAQAILHELVLAGAGAMHSRVLHVALEGRFGALGVREIPAAMRAIGCRMRNVTVAGVQGKGVRRADIEAGLARTGR